MGSDIALPDYIDWARELAPGEADLRAEVLSRLPARIIDVHCHANGADAVQELSSYAWGQVRSSFPTWSMEDSRSMQTLLFGDAEVARLRFAHPFRGIDHAVANNYLLAASALPDRVALCGLPDDPAYTISQLETGRYAALKMYPHYFEPVQVRLEAFFPDAIVAAAASLGCPLIIHLGLPLSQCVDELEALARRYPDLPMMLAHLGREHAVTTEVVAAFRDAARLLNVIADCSMATTPEVYDVVLDTLGPERILYGSDEPMNLLRMVAFEHPGLGRRFMSPRRYHWLDEEMWQEHHKIADDAVLQHWQVLSAVNSAIDRAHGSAAPAVIELVFAENAARWFPHFASSWPAEGSADR